MMQPIIYAVIVTYQGAERLSALLQALLPQITGAIIVDNGSDALMQTSLDAAQQAYSQQLEIVRNPDNQGLGAAQNQGIHLALAKDAVWVLLMDDDSIPDPAMVQRMLDTGLVQDEATIGIIAPRIVEQGVDVPSQYLALCGRFGFKRKTLYVADVACDAVSVIASGSLIRRELCTQIGLMNAGFFIDYIDHDFCLRARGAGYRIAMVGAAVLQHRQGHKTQHRFAGMNWVTANYSPQRRYTIFRNRLFVLRLHGRRYPFLLPYMLLTCSLDMLRVLLFEDQKWKKVGAGLRGLAHGISQRIVAAPPL